MQKAGFLMMRLKLMSSMITELQEIEPNGFLSPFLEVIRSEDTTGPITGLALTSVNKFLSYGLVGKYLKESPLTNMFLIDEKNIKAGGYKKIYYMNREADQRLCFRYNPSSS